MGALQAVLSVTAAALMLTSDAVEWASPHQWPGQLLLVNRSWPISSEYYPEVRLTNVQGQVRSLTDEAASALEEMFAACKSEIGVTLVSVSGYRPYDKQERIYKRKLKSVRGNTEKADEYVARPGTSEHQTGLTMDVGARADEKSTLAGSFGETRGGVWLRENCWRFGFILRYDEGWEDVTGYAYEPWHIRYVGKETAAYLHDHPMPLETYLLLLRTERLTGATPTDLK